MSSPRKPLMSSHHGRHGTTPLISHLGLNSLAPGCSPCPLQNRRSLTTSSGRTLLHLVQDYQKLNEITVKNSYLPLVSDVLTHLCGAEFFTVLDLCWGFNNMRIKEGDEWKATFWTNQGLFKPTVMFFGLRNSPAMFQ